VSISVPQLPHARGKVSPGAQLPRHAPDTHVWWTHATGAVHCPFGPQASTALPSHRFAPGVVQDVPVVHASVQASADPSTGALASLALSTAPS
jgi:hypothetical protein